MSEQPRQTPIQRALWRPLLVMGCEREAIFPLLGLTVLVPIACVNWQSLVLPLLFPFGYSLLRRMAKGDPQAAKVYRRHRGYKGYYPGSTSAYAGPGWGDAVFKAITLLPLAATAAWIAYRALT